VLLLRTTLLTEIAEVVDVVIEPKVPVFNLPQQFGKAVPVVALKFSIIGKSTVAHCVVNEYNEL